MQNVIVKILWGAGRLVIVTLVVTFLAVLFQTQRVISMMKNVGGEVGISERLSMTAYDLQHLGSLYGLLIFIALTIAFFTGWLVTLKLPRLKPYIYMGAGAVAMIVLLYAVKSVFFDVHIIAGARDGLGQCLQMLAGAAGGYLFWRLQRNKTSVST